MVRNESKKELIRDKRKRQKRQKIHLMVFLTLFLLITTAVLVIWKVFTVQNVEVKGNEHYSKEQIEKFVLSDEYAWNSLYVVLKHQFLETEEIPFVDTMEISLKDPHTLKIQVYEKGILGYLYIAAIDQNAYFDKDGFVVETSKEIIEGIPRVDGLNCEKVVLYEKLPLDNEKILKSLLTATQALKKNEVVPEKIEFAANGDMTLTYGKIEVWMGDEKNLTKKILRLPHILPQLSGKAGILHVEKWTENTTDIIFEGQK
ncbi:MAG: FtsQ-type POTRA domain-containing protein [Lachnospiraceae bacterium]|nr:FtsQ-type POTRA domain-containing protein [Lachnospiraceae bacterium]